MSLQHIYLESQVLSAETSDVFELEVSKDDLRHLRVLRVSVGEHVAVVDASLDYFECEFVDLSGELPCVRICGHLDSPRRPHVALVQGLAKGDKMEEVIRHATELGVSEFIPLVARRSVMKLDQKKLPKKMARWRSIAKSAAQQSGQPRVPAVSEPLGADRLPGFLSAFTCVLVCWEEAPSTLGMGDALKKALNEAQLAPQDASVAVVVGPEGGLTQEEVSAIVDGCPGGSLVSLGPSILRTETAGIVAPALALYELGAMGQVASSAYEFSSCPKEDAANTACSSGQMREGE